MSVTARAQGAGTPPPAAYRSEVPKGSTFLLVGAWVLLAQGALTLFFTPILVFSADHDIPPGRIGLFAACGLLGLGAGALVFARWPWSVWVALAVAMGTGAVIVWMGGLIDTFEPGAAIGFALTEVALFMLGRRTAGHPEALSIASARIPFRVKVTIVWVAIFFVLGVMFSLMQFDVAWMKENFRFIARGLEFTILLALGAIVLATCLALLGALGRLSHNPVAYGVSGFYTSFFRGTPLIVQLFLIYLALPQIAHNLGSLSLLNVLTLTGFQAGLLGLGLNYGAYMTEIFRAGIQSVSHGQGEAADALAMSYAQRMRRVVLPQATRVIIPPTGNEFIAMMKDTALVSVLGSTVGTAEVFRRASLVGPPSHHPMEALVLAAGLYWALTAIFTVFQSRLERRMSQGYVRSEVRGVAGQKRFQFLPVAGAGGPGGGAGGVIITGEGDDTETEETL